MAAVHNASMASPLADASHASITDTNYLDTVFSTVQGLSGWTILFTILAVLVAYDQV